MNFHDLFDYQKEGVGFLVDNRVALLADQPGLGKTAQAICAIRDFTVAWTRRPVVCVVCPKSAIENWNREIKRWGLNAHMLVVNYDVLGMGQPSVPKSEFLKQPWDFLILDEAHRLKSPGANRTNVIYGRVKQLHSRGTRVWLLTGTPARNHAGEMWTHLNALRPDLINDRSGRPMLVEQFEDRYCDVSYDEFGHRRIRGSKNIKELRDRLKAGNFMLRRMKKDVQADLPDLIFDTYPLNMPAASMLVLEQELKDLGIRSHHDDDAIITLLRHASPFISTTRRMVGMAKASAVAELVETELEAPGKIIVFFMHTVVGARLFNDLAAFKPVLVDGAVNNAQAQVDMFQSDPDCRVFLGQIQACGEALNITAANQVIFAETSWSPADNYQAACRAHRIGLDGGLVVRFAAAPGGLDDHIQQVLARKTSELTELFD